MTCCGSRRAWCPWKSSPRREPATSRETSLDVQRVLAELGENDRLALTLYYLNDLPIKDIAEMLQISEGAVKQRLSHGRKKFKEAYEERETGKVVARHAKK